LVGRHSNLVVLGPGDRVIDVLVPAPTPQASSAPSKTQGKSTKPNASAPTSAARAPRLVVGAPYSPPPGRPVSSSTSRVNAGCNSNATHLAASLPVPAQSVSLRRHETTNAAPLSWLVENSLGAQAEEAQDSRDRREVSERLERKRKNARSLVHGLEQRAGA